MSPAVPIAVRLPRAFAFGRVSMRQVLAPVVDGDLRAAVAAFRLSSRERGFARRLLRRRTQWWLWRTHQKRRAGDFALVDMSSPDPAIRTVWIVDLKLGRPVRWGGGGAGIQLVNASLAVDELARAGVIARGSEPVLAVGGGGALLEALGSRTDRARVR